MTDNEKVARAIKAARAIGYLEGFSSIVWALRKAFFKKEVDNLTDEIAKRDKGIARLKRQRDEARQELEKHRWEYCETCEHAEQVERLEAERDALRAENMSLKANSDECVPKAIKKRDEVIKILESERDEARAKCAELEAEANGLVGQIGDVEGSLLIAQGKNRELREKLSAAIGHAVEITRLQDLEAHDD